MLGSSTSTRSFCSYCLAPLVFNCSVPIISGWGDRRDSLVCGYRDKPGHIRSHCWDLDMCNWLTTNHIVMAVVVVVTINVEEAILVVAMVRLVRPTIRYTQRSSFQFLYLMLTNFLLGRFTLFVNSIMSGLVPSSENAVLSTSSSSTQPSNSPHAYHVNFAQSGISCDRHSTLRCTNEFLAFSWVIDFGA